MQPFIYEEVPQDPSPLSWASLRTLMTEEKLNHSGIGSPIFTIVAEDSW